MKNKPTRHKESNTFRFQPFAERIANINVDIFHRVGHEYETQLEENESLFHQAVEKWDVLNLTEYYSAFRKEVNANSLITLPQLVHSKDNVVQVLLKHLRYKNVLCLQALLELVVALANDLRKDFYLYYPEFLDVLIDLLNTKDTEQLEWTFTCLAYLFKFLWRPLTKDVNTVFNSLLPLLSDNKPDYINNFAAESFAFVVRKVKDRESFLSLILKVVKNNQDGVSGCGKLLFEVIRGVNGQFHSCADTMLPFLLESLANNKLPQSILFEILEEAVINIASNIHPQKSELFWKSCITILEKVTETWNSKPTEDVSNYMALILKLVGQALEFRSGKLLQVPVPVAQIIIKLVTLLDLPESVLLVISQVSVLLLLSKNVRLPQEQASALTRKILCVPNKILLHFVDHVMEYSSFEALILPTFLKHCILNNLDKDSLQVLTRLILRKSPLCGSGINLQSWTKYPVDFNLRRNNAEVYEILMDYVNVQNTDLLLKNINQYMCAVICLPHLTLDQHITKVKQAINNNLRLLCAKLETESVNSSDDHKVKQLLYLLLNTLECAVHIIPSEDLVTHMNSIMKVILPLTSNVTLISSLKVLDLYLSAVQNEEGVFCLDTLRKLHEVLEENFSSPYHEVRQLTTHIYTLFENLSDLKPSATSEEWKIFSICYNVESISPQVQTYRDQLQNLERLSCDKQQMNICKHTEFKKIPLRYLCGVLYMNFKLLWEPTVNIIASHAHGLELVDFWSVFVEELKTVVVNIRQPVEFKDVHLESGEFLNELYQGVYKIDIKPDFVNYRLLLWKAMALFPEIAEVKTRDVSELLLKFMEDEYMKSNSDSALMWNIKQNTEEEVVMDVDNQDEEDVIKKELTKAVPKARGSNNLKALQHYLMVFTKIRSPKSMYREPELYKLYFDLLSHKHHEVQKTALDCILTYKHKYLTPYQDHLYNLINEKNFKDELATFRVDKESSIVQAEHREHLIPIVLKIVYSKMFAKTGLRTGGKSSGQLRRNLVLRFLAGCHENEMLNFIHMAFRFYTKYFEDNLKDMLENISGSVDLEKFIPPKRLQSTLNLLTVVLEQFGGLMANELLSFLLKVLFVIGAAIKGAFVQVVNIHAGYLSMLRTLRTSCIKIVERFFGHFESYPWNCDEINAVFSVFVWPYLDKLTVEGIHSPTSLLKLFVQWGANPRYFPLLMKHHSGDANQYVLPHIMKLLVNKQSHGSVVNSILEMFEKLLSLVPDEEELELKIPIDDLLPISDDILNRLKLNEKLNYGSCVLLPHVPAILEIIKRKLESKYRSINRRELFILSRISELIWEANISDEVLKLLLPVMLKKCSSGEETVLKFVSTVSNLLQNVHEPQKHFKQLSPLFGDISYVSSRKILCATLEGISKRFDDTKLSVMAALVLQLNAWDAKWVDQPDFQRRLDGFKEVQRIIENDSLELTLGVIIIHNCYYMIRSENDLSLRENAAHCWKSVSSALIKKYESCSKATDYILNEILFAMIRKGFKSKNDEVRNECILLLGHLARECSNAHVVLRDLNKLTNKTDVEVDFFENITHLQVHRHARALLKFCQIFKQEENAPSPRTLTQFVLPLATFYLCSEKYAQKNSLIDGAIDVVSTVSKLLPWHQYEGILKFYLTKLRHKAEYQKQLVRLMVAVLDAFHFDLSKGHVQVMKPKGGKTNNVSDSSDQAIQGESDESVSENKDNVGETKVQETEEVVEEESEKMEEEQEVDEVLDVSVEDDLEEAVEEEIEEAVEKLKAVEKTRVLCQSTATRVIRTIQLVLLPQLHRALAELTHHESSHKVNRKRTGFEREEEDLLRVPISLAVVKLLQRLPKEILDVNLPGVFMKLCTFLKSQLESVRRMTRETLQKIMLTLGPQYLGLLLEEMSPLLSRGFQVHVLVYTTHSVLVCLKDKYQPTDLDKILLPVLDLCKVDLFGTVADEKEIIKIGRKVSEAKSTKSFDTLQILAQYITDKCLMDMLLPIKTVLANSHSFKIIHKAQESLRHIALGLVENTFVPLESLLKFAYGTSSESIPELLANKEKIAAIEKEKNKRKQKADCFIIPLAPVGRSGVRRTGVKSSEKANAHVLVEFGLRLCHYLLKKEKLKDDEYRAFIDPFVAVFKNCLSSRHVKLSTLTFQCLSRLMKYDLPSMKENVVEITESMFAILHKYAAAGLSKGDNFELVVAAFKAMAVLVRDVKYYTIETDQLKILLLYVEQDLHNHDRQAIAFALLRAIISRKLMTPEINPVMEKVAQLSITSELSHVRLQARLVFHQFLMDYPLKNKIAKHVAFYISQLNYELQFGRESAIEMIQSLIVSFPINVLKEHSGTFLVTLGARLVNDDVSECRKMVADCLTTMFKRLPRPDVDPLFDIMILWLQDKKKSHRQLAAQLCGLLIVVEKSSFETRLPTLIPVVLIQFGVGEECNKPGRFVLAQQETDEEDNIEGRLKDHHLFQVLQMLLKICAQCPAFLKRTEDIQTLSEYIQTLLGYPHEWVRLAAAQFLGFVLSSLDIDKLANLLVSNKTEEVGYLYSDPVSGIKSLTLDLCAQLQPGSIKSDLAEQVIKNLVFVARVLQKVPLNNAESGQKINLLWLTKRLRKIVNTEVVETPTSIILRNEVFKWIAGVGTALDLEKIISVLHHLLAPLVREMITTEESNAPLRQLSKEVGNLLKKRVGMELYSSTLSKLQQQLSVRRADRKRERTQLAVTDPEMYAKKKIKLHEKKKLAKKKKIDQKKGKVRKFKKRKIEDFDNSLDSSEIM